MVSGTADVPSPRALSWVTLVFALGCGGATCPPAPVSTSSACMSNSSLAEPSTSPWLAAVGGDTPWMVFADLARGRATEPGARLDGLIQRALAQFQTASSEAALNAYRRLDRFVLAGHPALRREPFILTLDGSGSAEWIAYMETEAEERSTRGAHTVLRHDTQAGALLEPTRAVFGAVPEVNAAVDRAEGRPGLLRRPEVDALFAEASRAQPVVTVIAIADEAIRQELYRDRDFREFAADALSFVGTASATDSEVVFSGHARLARPEGASALVTLIEAGKQELAGAPGVPDVVRDAVLATSARVDDSDVYIELRLSADEFRAILDEVEREIFH